MPLIRKSKSKRLPSVSSTYMSEEDSSGRKCSVSVSVEIVQSSLTKRQKKSVPGSPDYQSQSPVTITAKATQPLRRKLSFGSLVYFFTSAQSANLKHLVWFYIGLMMILLLAPPISKVATPVQETKHLRKPSQKTLYMAGTSSARREKKESRSQEEPLSDVDIIIPSPVKKSVTRLTKKSTNLPAVKLEYDSDIDIHSSPTPVAQPKGKNSNQPRLATPIDISSDEGDADEHLVETPKPKQKMQGSSAKYEAMPRTPQNSPTCIVKAKDQETVEEAEGHLIPGEENQHVSAADCICTICPNDSTRGPAYAPSDLRDPDTDKPIFLQPHAFQSMFEEPVLGSLMASVQFDSLYPFVNPSKFSPDGLAISDYKNITWPGSKENAVCVMIGAVNSCNIIHPMTAGANRIRALTIIPSIPAYHNFQHFLWKKYSTSILYGPFDCGCLLTFTSRREGLMSSYGSSQPPVISKGRKRNMKAFGSSAAAPPATLWYEKNFPPFIDYDQDIPIYDAQLKPFMFTKADFVALPSLPRYKKAGDPKLADLSPNSLVSVFFTMNTYMSSRVSPTPTPSSSSRSRHGDPQTPGGSSSSSRSDSTSKVPSQVLSLNLQFLIYHGEMPDVDED
ncbi:hypothetical protein BYT27DRAFT_7260466 [Phlegmacium glaucopus]|nr:hypothetical protein BYT27DRAFT_7260466 [Phlegmacium glaucopus]